LLRTAIASDPDFAPPYALASTCFLYRIAQGWSETAKTDRQLGTEMARTAARLGPDDPTVLALAGYSLAFLAQEHDIAVALTERALNINPNSTTVLQLGGWVRLLASDPEDAMAYFLRGARINPIDTKRFVLDTGLARACVMLGRYEEAIYWARKSLASAPQWIFAALPLSAALAMVGRRDEATVSKEQLLARIPRYSVKRDIGLHRPGPARDKLETALAEAGLPP